MIEIEAKFLPQDTEHFDHVLWSLSEQGYAITGGQTESLVDRYLDTPEMTLFRAGWTYRWREKKHEHTLILKRLEPKAGSLFIREEISQRMMGNACIPHDPPEGPVKTVLGSLLQGRPCRELFRVKSKRTSYLVSRKEPQTTQFKLALDRARVIAPLNDDREEPLHFEEFELELLEGDERDLERVAAVLGTRRDLVSAQLSKFERGLHAVGLDALDGIGTQGERKLDASSSLLDLVFQHLRVQLRALQQQQPHACEGLDPEGVHQMRIAIRKSRSVLRTFRDILETFPASQLRKELRWIGRCLGDVRDADVFQRSFKRLSSGLPDFAASALEPFEEFETRSRQMARSRLLDAFSSSRFTTLQSELNGFVEAGPTAESERTYGDLRIVDATKSYVRPLLEKLRKRGRRIRKKSPPRDLHQLRIEAKRLRYLLEFLASVEGKRWKKLIKATRRLQNVLGEHHDACAARGRIQGFAGLLSRTEGSADTGLALRQILERQEKRLSKSQRRFPKEWNRFWSVARFATFVT